MISLPCNEPFDTMSRLAGCFSMLFHETENMSFFI